MQKKIADDVSADKVEDIMDQLAEQNDLQQEVADLFAQSGIFLSGWSSSTSPIVLLMFVVLSTSGGRFISNSFSSG